MNSSIRAKCKSIYNMKYCRQNLSLEQGKWGHEENQMKAKGTTRVEST